MAYKLPHFFPSFHFIKKRKTNKKSPTHSLYNELLSKGLGRSQEGLHVSVTLCLEAESLGNVACCHGAMRHLSGSARFL